MFASFTETNPATREECKSMRGEAVNHSDEELEKDDYCGGRKGITLNDLFYYYAHHHRSVNQLGYLNGRCFSNHGTRWNRKTEHKR